MRFQPRDLQILIDIYKHDGVVAKRHLKEKYWLGKTERAMEQRLAKLVNADYLSRPTREQRRSQPIPEPVFWLGWQGILSVAGHYGIKIDPPKSDNEYQLRSFQKKLRDAGIRWVREPRWIQLAHDISVIDFKMAIEKSLENLSNLFLKEWVSEGSFRSDMDVVVYTIQDKYGKEKQIKKGICPDGYFEIVDEVRKRRGEQCSASFLLEIDMATHDNPSFGREKVIPGIEYIRSTQYKKRFGSNGGFWLIVTKGQKTRLKNLMKQVKDFALNDSSLFFFTTIDEIHNVNLFTEPVWHQVDIDRPVALLE